MALAIRQMLGGDNPTVTKFQYDLAASHHHIGILLSDTGKPAAALAGYQQALSIQGQLARENPTVALFQSDLAQCHYAFGRVLSTAVRLGEALM